MKIQALGYDPEADELDLLIDADVPQPAESIAVDAGVYIRQDVKSGRVVGAVIRGYGNFLHTVLEGRDIPSTEAAKAGLEKEFRSILEWQREALRLSRDLIAHLGTSVGEDRYALVETLLAQAG
ncbi:MAG: hypothetical protein ACRERD_22420 [Candidatus Binatia bacterium]